MTGWSASRSSASEWGASTRGAPRLVVVGGDAAGMSAAAQAKRLAPELEVVVLEEGPHISYAACGISLLVGGAVSDPSDLLAFTPESAGELRGIQVRVWHRVQELDLGRRRLAGVVAGSGESFSLGFDSLVLATGARPLRPPLPGVELPGVFTLRSLSDGLRLRQWLDRWAPRRAVVAGAGYVGLDMAQALRARSMAVTIVKDRPTPLLGLEPELSALAEEELVRNGCLLLRDAPLFCILERGSASAASGSEGALATGPPESSGSVVGVRAGGEDLAADLVLLALGVRPRSRLAEGAGLRLGHGGAVEVDSRARTSAPGVYAAGDCATQIHRVTGRIVYVTQALAANRQGRVAGANAAMDLLGSSGDGRPRPEHPGTLGTAVLRIFDAEVGLVGLGLAAAREAGLDAVATVITSRTNPGYYPTGGPMKVALIAERRTGRLLGGQVAGAAGAAKRVDTLATALHAGMDLAALAELDLGYAPHFSPVRDPILIAARQALRRV